uniref:Zinc finger, CCHC-type n=1 Tax=Tanacetum cinerariifolium TaxID=118510 RepID=A0A699HRK3_TANCI|nr:zinc finger, CCHC-type [Tanacetum cinerariifolium]
MCLYIDAEGHELGDLGEPANYKAALLDHESEKWLNAMNVEIDIRILIAIATYYDYEIWKMDVKTALLNGYLNEEVCMEQPEGVKSYLGRCFAMKDLGDAAYILGIKIYRDRSRRLIGLCQSAYIEKILKRYCMENSKRGSIPMQEKLKLSKSQGASTPAELKRMQNVPYASVVGSIMYDSPTGYVFILNGGAVYWKSDKQSIFSTSPAKAEYIAAFDASKEAVWVRKFISWCCSHN